MSAMKPRPLIRLGGGTVLRAWALTGALISGAVHGLAAPEAPSPEFTNLAQLRRVVSQERRQVCSFRLDGMVRAANAAEGVLFLQDDSEADLIELDWGRRPLLPGQRVRLEGTNCAVARSSLGLRFGRVPVVDVDGSHPPVEGAGAAYLGAGLHAIRLAWFNDILGCVLTMEY